MEQAVPPPTPLPRTTLASQRWFGWLLATIALLLGLTGTVAAWYMARTTERASELAQFEIAANNVVNEITDRLTAQIQTLWGTVGLVAANPDMTREKWRAYVSALRLQQRLPGARAVGFARRVLPHEREAHIRAMQAEGFTGYHIWPPGERAEYFPVTYIEPFDERTTTVLGFDAATGAPRRSAIELARDSGEPTMTAKLTLIREQAQNSQPGFILFLPVYRDGAPAATLEQRRATLIGYTYSTFRVRDFLSERTVHAHSGLELEVYDGAGVNEDNLLYRSSAFPEAAALGSSPYLVTTIAEIVGGRTWTFRLAAGKPFTTGIDQHAPLLILAGGLLISLLASIVIGSLAMNRAQAIAANNRLIADMAQRAKVEEALRESEAKFRQLFDNIPLPTFAIDRESLRYVAVNEAALAKYGYSPGEFATMRITDIRPKEDVPALLAFLDSVRGEARYATEMRHVLRDGTTIDVEIMGHSIMLGDRELTIVVANDVTERKRAQAALAESEQQLHQAQKLEAVGQLTGGVAHDFNNILTVITGTIEILADAVAHDRNLSAITRLIDEAAKRGADLTRDLLAFARKQPLAPRETDINDLVLSAVKLYRSALGGHIGIETHLDPSLASAFVDPGQLTTALLNLALNARDAMPDGGKLLLETANVELDDAYAQLHSDVRSGPYVMIAVSDTGAGIAPDVLDKVFEPFFTTKEVGKGTGLGLSMVYGFVRQSEGHVKIYSEPGYGTTIKLYLPRGGGLAAPLQPEAPEEIAGGDEAILVVEDDPLVRNSVTTQLRRLGYTAHVVANAEEALALIDAGTGIDLLFTDIVMPGPFNGRALAEEARRRRPDLRVLFTSGYTHEAALRNGRLPEGERLLNKPYRTAELARKIRQALSEKTPLRTGTVSHDEAEHFRAKWTPVRVKKMQ